MARKKKAGLQLEGKRRLQPGYRQLKQLAVRQVHRLVVVLGFPVPQAFC